MRAVVDTNLLLRMAASRQHLPLYKAWREKRFVLVVSSTLLNELKNVMEKPKVRRFLPPIYGDAFVTLLHSLAVTIQASAVRGGRQAGRNGVPTKASRNTSRMFWPFLRAVEI